VRLQAARAWDIDRRPPGRASAQVLGFVFTACAVVARSGQIVTARADWSDVHTFNWRYDALFAIPIIVFGFNCHANVVTIFSCARPRRRPACSAPALRTSQGPAGGGPRCACCFNCAPPQNASGLPKRQLSCVPCGAVGCAPGCDERCMAGRGRQPARKAADALRARRELQDRPKQILGGLPTRPHEYAALGPAIAPRPRTIKLARRSCSSCGCRARGPVCLRA